MGKRRSFNRLPGRVSRRFVNGLIVLVPLAITLFVIVETLNFTEGVLGKNLPFYFPGMGMLTLILAVYCVGWLSSYWFMRRVILAGERILGKIPIVKFIYNSVKHLSTAVFETNNMFDQVVLVPFHQSKALGFLMADVPETLEEQLGDDYLCVFVPWSLNMTSGTNLFVKKEDVIFLDISSESALQYMLTAGAVMPKRLDPEDFPFEILQQNRESSHLPSRLEFPEPPSDREGKKSAGIRPEQSRDGEGS